MSPSLRVWGLSGSNLLVGIRRGRVRPPEAGVGPTLPQMVHSHRLVEVLHHAVEALVEVFGRCVPGQWPEVVAGSFGSWLRVQGSTTIMPHPRTANTGHQLIRAIAPYCHGTAGEQDHDTTPHRVTRQRCSRAMHMSKLTLRCS